MRRWMIACLLLILSLPAGGARASQAGSDSTPTPTPTPPAVQIQSPLDGQPLQGSLPIIGSNAAPGFMVAAMYFAYSGDPTGTWFLIREITGTVTAGPLVQWDTTTITDGEYDLRLVVRVQNGAQQTATVRGLRVRNYTPIETSTPTPVTPTATTVPGDTPVPTTTSTPTQTPLPPTGTPLPPNPAEIDTRRLGQGAWQGALGLAGLFAASGLYLALKRLRTRG